MTFRVLAIVVAPFWMVGGLMMAMSPPLDGRRGQASPALGAVIVVFAVVMMAAGIRQMAAPRGRPPRHSRGERDTRAVRIFSVGGVVAVLIGGICLWSGIDEGNVALAGLGVITLSASGFAIPIVKDSSSR